MLISRYFRFRLRTLLGATLAMAVGIGIVAGVYRDRQLRERKRLQFEQTSRFHDGPVIPSAEGIK